MLNFASLKLLPDDGRDTNLDEGKFEPIGSVLQLHACKQGLDLIAYNCRKVFDIKGAEDEGVLRFAVSDGRFYTDNVFLQPEVAAKFKFSRRKSYAVRFTEVSVFDKATHVLGVRDFTLIKELKLDWQVAIRGWRRVTPADINRVRPTIGEKPVSTDVTSPSKMKKQFI